MKPRMRVVSIVLVVIIAVTITIVLCNNGTFVSAEQLQTEGFVLTPSKEYAASFYRDKTEVNDVSLLLEPVPPHSFFASMTVYFSNHPGILDSLSLDFKPAQGLGGVIQCYFESPTSVPATVKTGADGLSTIVEANDLGTTGEGSFYLQFLIEPFQANSFWFEVNFTMRPTGFPPTRQTGSAQIELPFTFANST